MRIESSPRLARKGDERPGELALGFAWHREVARHRHDRLSN